MTSALADPGLVTPGFVAPGISFGFAPSLALEGLPGAESVVPVLLLLVAGIASALLVRKIGVSPIVGYFLGGMLIGPHALGLVEEGPTLHLLAEMGVVFLLFDIGLHFSVRRLWESRRQIFGLGPLQILLVGAAAAPVAILLGLPPVPAILVGGGLALSSTAVVVRHLIESRKLGSPVGRAAVSILIFQDIAAVVLLVVAGALGREDASLAAALGATAIRAVVAVAAVSLVGRWLLRPAFAWITRSENEEVFTATALLTVLATAAATGAAGLSMPLGAFLGGLLLSETEYCYLVKSELKPFRGLLLGLFFLTVGMSLELGVVAGQPLLVLALLAGLLVVKTIGIAVAARLAGTERGPSIELAFLLAQGSEFALVLFGLAPMRETIGPEPAACLVAAVVASLALTPLLARAGTRLALRTEIARTPASGATERSGAPEDGEGDPHAGRVFVIGLGEIGRGLARALDTAGIAYLGFDHDPVAFASAKAEGLVVSFGDARDPKLVEEASVESARAVVLTETAPGEESEALARHVARRHGGVECLAATSDPDEKRRLEAVGVTVLEPEGSEASARVDRLARHLFDAIACDATGVARWQRDTDAERTGASKPVGAVPRPD